MGEHQSSSAANDAVATVIKAVGKFNGTSLEVWRRHAVSALNSKDKRGYSGDIARPPLSQLRSLNEKASARVMTLAATWQQKEKQLLRVTATPAPSTTYLHLQQRLPPPASQHLPELLASLFLVPSCGT